MNISIDTEKMKEYKQSMKKVAAEMKEQIVNTKAMGCPCACCKMRDLIRFAVA